MKPDFISHMSKALRTGDRTGAAALVRLITRSFRAKVIALVVLSVLVPSGLIWIFTVENTERFQTERTRDRFNEAMNDAVREIGYWYRERLTDMDRLLASTAFRRPLTDITRVTEQDAEYAAYQSEIEHYLEIVRDRFPVYQSFVVVAPDGSIIWSNTTETPANMTDGRAGLDRSGGAALVTPALFDAERTASSQWLAAPVEIDGSMATVFVRMDLTLLGEHLAAGDGVLDKYVVTTDGTLVTPPNYTVTAGGLAAVGSKLDYLPRSAAGGEIDRYQREIMREGEAARTAFIGSRAPVAGQDLWLVCEAEESRFIAPTLTRKNRVLVANSLICVLFVLAGWRLSQYLLEPLRQLRQGAQRINEGMAGVQIAPVGNDEITDMIHAFNEMAQKISVSQAQLNAQNKLLQNQNTELAESNDTLERLSVTDGLTGLYNHRHFWTLVDQQIATAGNENKPALVLLDIDDFKQVNDKYGHAVGDILITKVADVLRATIRSGDYLSRYGGEEFAVLLPRTSPKGALSLSEKIRAAIEKMRVIVPDTGIALSVTVSIGVSVYDNDKREFFNAADRALYASKANGKNCVNHEIVGA